jgi:hypothetical protein
MRSRSLSIGLAALALAGCDPTGNTNISFGAADLRFANFLTDSAVVTLSIGGLAIHSAVPFGEPTPYAAVAIDDQVLDFTRVSDGLAFGSDTVNFIDGRHYTFYALGIASAFKGKLATDDTVFAAAGQVKVRFLHGVKTQFSKGIDLYLSLPTDTLGLLTPIVPSLAYGSASAYVPVDTAFTRLRLTITGDTATVFDSTFAAAIPDSSVVTIVATDKVGGGAPVRVQVVVDKAP